MEPDPPINQRVGPADNPGRLLLVSDPNQIHLTELCTLTKILAPLLFNKNPNLVLDQKHLPDVLPHHCVTWVSLGCQVLSAPPAAAAS